MPRVSKWVARYRQGGVPELEDLSSAPFRCPARTSAETVDLIEHWRRTHKWSARRISHELPVRGTVVSARTVTRWLDRAGLNQRRDTRPHQADQPGQQTDPGSFPGPHDPPGRQEGWTHPTWGRLAGPRARNPQSQSLQTRQRSQDRLHLPAHRHRRLLTSGLHRGPRRVRRPPPQSASSAAPGPSSPPTASPGSCGSSPTTGPTAAPGPSPRPSPPWPHATRGPVPTPHGTTARSSATTASWQRSASTRVPTPHSSSAVTPSRCGTTTTTTIDPTPPATASLLPPASQHTSPTS